MKNNEKVFIVCICFLAAYLLPASTILGGGEEQLIPLLMRSKGINIEKIIEKNQKVKEAQEKTLNRAASNAPFRASLPIAETISMTSKTGGGIYDLTWDGSFLWGIDGDVFEDPHYISKINSADGTILDSFVAPIEGSSSDGSAGVAYGNGYFWVLNYLDEVIYAVDPSTGQVDTGKSIALTNFTDVLAGGAWDGDHFWFGMWDYGGNSATIYQIDVNSSEILKSETIAAETIYDLDFAQGSLWVTVGDLEGNDYIYKIDPASITVLEQYDKNPCTYGLTYDGSYLWASDWCRFEYYKFTLGSSVTTSINGGTTTTSVCPSESIYGEDSEETELLRYIRDNLLRQSPEGQEIIRLYYQWSPAIAKAMEEDEAFKAEVKEMVDGVLELITETE